VEYWGITGCEAHFRTPSLIPKNVLMGSVASFTFRFFLANSRYAIASPTMSSNRTTAVGSQSVGLIIGKYNVGSSGFPMFLLEEPKRAKNCAIGQPGRIKLLREEAQNQWIM
jgi:hypothetical protein